MRVVGLGAVSALGRGVDALWQGALSGRVALERPVSSDPNRVFELAVMACVEALEETGWRPGQQPIGLVVSTTKGQIAAAQQVLQGQADAATLSHFPLFQLAPRIARQLKLLGPVQTVSVACASGTTALGVARRWLQQGRAHRILVVGADALSEFVMAGFSSLRALSRSVARPFDVSRDGLALGEGSACIALASGDGPARALVIGYGGSNDANHITGPARDGAGLVRAVRAALSCAQRDIGDIDAISAHGTGTRFNDRMEAMAWATLTPQRRIPVHGIKGAIGHTLGAAGLLEAVLCVRGLETGWWPPTAGLQTPDPELRLDLVLGEARRVDAQCVVSTSSGFSGINAAVVLCRP